MNYIKETYHTSRIYTKESTSNTCCINQNMIVYTIFRIIGNQMEFRLVPNPSENGKYNLIPVN